MGYVSPWVSKPWFPFHYLSSSIILLSFYPSICLSVCLSIYLSIYLKFSQWFPDSEAHSNLPTLSTLPIHRAEATRCQVTGRYGKDAQCSTKGKSPQAPPKPGAAGEILAVEMGRLKKGEEWWKSRQIISKWILNRACNNKKLETQWRI